MATKVARRIPERSERPVFERVAGGNRVNNTVCKYWLAGRCNRNPCRFLHRESPPPQPKQSSEVYEDNRHFFPSISTWRNPNYNSSKNVPISTSRGAVSGSKIAQVAQQKVSKCEGVAKNEPISMSGGEIAQEAQQKVLKSEGAANNVPFSTSGGAAASGDKIAQEAQQKVSKSEGAGSGGESIQKTKKKLCEYWVTGNCVEGDNCKNLHSWFCGEGFSMLAKLEGHSQAVTGIALPPGSDKLYSGSKDKSVRVWDCNTGQCADVIHLEGETGSLISEGPWLFLGLPNAIKAGNTENHTELTLNGPVGQVYAMVVGNDMFFAGTENGTILAWKSSSETSCPELAASLKGHSHAVLSLAVGAKNRLYSGSMDHTIRVWDLETFQCMHTLNGHSNSVTSVLCWDSFLLSGSLDNTIKVWAATESGNLEVVYERNEEHGVLSLCGINDAEAKPILLCSCDDNVVRLYELPLFTERGRIFAKREVQVIQIGPGGLFFTGDATGHVFVWKLHGEPIAVAS